MSDEVDGAADEVLSPAEFVGRVLVEDDELGDLDAVDERLGAEGEAQEAQLHERRVEHGLTVVGAELAKAWQLCGPLYYQPDLLEAVLEQRAHVERDRTVVLEAERLRHEFGLGVDERHHDVVAVRHAIRAVRDVADLCEVLRDFRALVRLGCLNATFH